MHHNRTRPDEFPTEGNPTAPTADYRGMNTRTFSTALVAVALVASACTRTVDAPDPTADGGAVRPAPFPVTVADCAGEPTTFDGPPATVVTANLAALELVIRLGRADSVAGTGWASGVSTLPDDVREAAETVPVLSTGGIPKEVLLTTGAQAYIDAFGSMQMMGGDGLSEEEMTAADMRHVVLSSSACAATLQGARTDLDAVYRDIESIGAILDASAPAADLVADMKDTIAEVAVAHPPRDDRPTVFYYSPDHTTQGMTTVGGKQIANAIYELAGARNAFTDDATSMRPVSWEDVIAADPDFIQIAVRNKASAAEQSAAYAAALDTLRSDPRARDLRAVREQRFIDLGAEETTLPGIVNAAAVATIANAVDGS